MFGLKIRGKTLIFMSSHFDETMTFLISHYLRFDALKILTGDYSVLRIEYITYLKQGKCIMFDSFQYFFQHFVNSIFPHAFVQDGVQMSYGHKLHTAS